MAKNILVAYYSQSGQTKRMAEMIAEKTGADMYEIVPWQIPSLHSFAKWISQTRRCLHSGRSMIMTKKSTMT